MTFISTSSASFLVQVYPYLLRLETFFGAQIWLHENSPCELSAVKILGHHSVTKTKYQSKVKMEYWFWDLVSFNISYLEKKTSQTHPSILQLRNWKYSAHLSIAYLSLCTVMVDWKMQKTQNNKENYFNVVGNNLIHLTAKGGVFLIWKVLLVERILCFS